MGRRLVVAAARWYRFVSNHPTVSGLVWISLGATVAGVFGLVSAAWGTGWWPGFGVGVTVAALLVVGWALFVLGLITVLRVRAIPLERFLDS